MDSALFLVVVLRQAFVRADLPQPKLEGLNRRHRRPEHIPRETCRSLPVLHSSMAEMTKAVREFSKDRDIEKGSAPSPARFCSAFISFPDRGLALRCDHVDRVRVRAAGIREQRIGCSGNDPEHLQTLVVAGVVGHPDVAGYQGWSKALADLSGKGRAVGTPSVRA